VSFVLDTSVAIELRDFNDALLNMLADLVGTAHFSIITQIELLNGLHSNVLHRELRAQRISLLLRRISVLEFDSGCASAYEAIVAKTSFSRRKILDRNPNDFSYIPNLKVIGW
jgi:predicted nucleic acid-binding protein